MSMSNAVSVNQLYHLVGIPKCPIIVDVRIPEDFEDDPRMIPGAIKRDFDNINLITEEFVDQTVIIYCQKGFKISQGTAAILRHHGIVALFLEGGQFAWRDAKLPLVTASNIPRDTNESASLWVTRHKPKIDCIACAWLIKRFIDPLAKILFVEPSQVKNVADRFKSTPFDVEGVHFSHRENQCSFDMMLEEFGLISEPLKKLAHIVRGADTNNHDLAPEVPGLLALSVGLSHMYDDDLKQLEAGMLIYDVYYSWARDAKDEGHDLSSAFDTQVSQ